MFGIPGKPTSELVSAIHVDFCYVSNPTYQNYFNVGVYRLIYMEDSRERKKDDVDDDLLKILVDAKGGIHSMFDNTVEYEKVAEEISCDNNLDRSEIEMILSNLVQSEVNRNRNLYRSIIYQNLNCHDSNWDSDIPKSKVKRNIDRLIDITVELWIENHINEFSKEIYKNCDINSESLLEKIDTTDIARLGVSIVIIEAVIDKTSNDLLDRMRGKVEKTIEWFLNNTSLSVEDISLSIEAMLRALFGV